MSKRTPRGRFLTVAAVTAWAAVAACSGADGPPTDPATTENDGSGSGSNDGTASAMSQSMTIELTTLSLGPVPAGTPERFALEAGSDLDPAAAVEGTWRALDGDPGIAPREGPARFELGDASAITVVLRSPEAPLDTPDYLRLDGIADDGKVEGSFADGLFAPRAGRFSGQFD